MKGSEGNFDVYCIYKLTQFNQLELMEHTCTEGAAITCARGWAENENMQCIIIYNGKITHTISPKKIIIEKRGSTVTTIN